MAIDSYHPDVAPTAEELRDLLNEQGEDEAAKAARQQVMDPPDPERAPTAAANLDVLLPPQEDSGAATATHQRGARSGRDASLVIWAERTRADTLRQYFGRDSTFRREYRVSVRVMPFDRTEDLEEAFTGLTAEGQLPPGHRVPPDMVVGPHDWTGQVIGKGLVSEPPPILNERHRIDTKALAAVSSGGRLYAMPYVFDTVALIRNDTLAGHGDLPATIDEVVEAGRDALRSGDITRGLPLALQAGKPDDKGDAGDTYHLWPLFASAGGSFFGWHPPVAEGDTRTAGTFADPRSWRSGFIDAFTRIALLGSGPGGSGALRPEISRARALTVFLDGRAPFFICSSRALKSIKAKGMKITVGVVPRLGTHPAQTMVSVYGFFIYRDAPNEWAARDMLSSYLSNPQAGVDLNRIQPLVPVQPAAMRHLAERDPLLRPYIDQCRTGMIMPSYPEMREAWRLLGQTEYKVLAGEGGDPGQLAADVADQGRDMLAKARGT